MKIPQSDDSPIIFDVMLAAMTTTSNIFHEWANSTKVTRRNSPTEHTEKIKKLLPLKPYLRAIHIDIPSAFRAQKPKIPGVAPGAIEATAPAS